MSAGNLLLWEAEIELPSSPGLLYKYIITDETNNVFLEEATPRLVELEQEIVDKVVCINDTWQASVIALPCQYFPGQKCNICGLQTPSLFLGHVLRRRTLGEGCALTFWQVSCMTIIDGAIIAQEKAFLP